MPFLRVIRDKRGYETTYLMHWYREGGRQRSRILYVFRTPGGVRVGRHPLDPDVQSQLEVQYPDIEFDWAVVRDNQQLVEAAIERRRKPRRPEADEPAPPTPEPPPAPRAEPRAEAPAGPRPPAVPSAIQGATPEEQIAFLQEWYQQIVERIPLRTSDPARQEILRTLAERLNPAAWTDADQITAGLQQAAEALERLSHVFARRRRRARRGGGRTSGGTGGGDDGSSDNAQSES